MRTRGFAMVWRSIAVMAKSGFVKTHAARTILALFLASLPVSPAIAETSEPAPKKHEFVPGQVWTFHLDPQAPKATLMILRVESFEKLGQIVHVSISAARTPNGVTSIPQLAFSRDALDSSVVELVRIDTSPLDLSGYEAWKAADGGAFKMTVSEALELIGKSAPVAADVPCTFDRDQLLALNEHEFDQDMALGWRKLAMREKCQDEAADLIHDYREKHKLDSPILFWHEGQVRAEMGQTEAAIRLFRLSRKPSDPGTGWNEYVEASVAFLRNDRPAFDKARAALAVLPQPAAWNLRKPNGELVAWPMNLEVVDELGRCFGLPYKQAYGRCKK